MKHRNWIKTFIVAAACGVGTTPLLADVVVDQQVNLDQKITAQSSTVQPANKSSQSFEGYDFEHVVERMATSVDPLQREMQASFKVFVDSIDEAEKLLDEGKTREAVQKCAAAVEAVIAVRDDVLTPMWQGQEFLQGQVAMVRQRLARAVEASNQDQGKQLNQQAEKALDDIARRIAAEDDPLRKKRLVAHYRTVRSLSQIRQYADQLSPDQRKLWTNVLSVLEQAALTHQQVLMGSEVLFAQFEATAENLNEYLTLMDTVDGASDLIGAMKGSEGQDTGLAAFAQNMTLLQEKLGGFNQALEGSLQESMFELEGQIESIQPAADGADAGVISSDTDLELAERLEKLAN